MVIKTKKQSDETIELKPGCYNVTLQEPYEKEIEGQKIVRFPFKVDGIVGKIKPFYFYLFKSEIGDDKLKFQRFNTLAMAIRKCFLLYGPFNEDSYKKWVGRKGRVIIGRHASGNMGVVFFMCNSSITPAKVRFIEHLHTFEYE